MMSKEYLVGSKLAISKDVPDLMEWIEKRVSKRSKEPMDLVFLSLLVAEVCILLARDDWCYDEPVDESVVGIRMLARDLAKAVYSKFKPSKEG